MTEYAIYGGDKGVSRLDILQSAVGDGTNRFLSLYGNWEGKRCLDLACGSGNVAFVLAEKVGNLGTVSGVDLDAANIQKASQTAQQRGIGNVTFVEGNAYEPDLPGEFDVVYIRFLLSHLHDPEIVLHNVHSLLAEPGEILIEDTDFSGHFSYPGSHHFDEYVRLYQDLLSRRKADANIGKKLATLLEANGFSVKYTGISQPVHRHGQGKLMAEITFEGISDALVREELITAAEAVRILEGLREFRQREDTLISLPRIVQVRAVRR